MTRAHLVLMHSPLVGRTSWEAVAERVRSLGGEATAPRVRLADVGAAFAAAPPGVGVLHSAAGFWAHLMGERPLVFVDALLPAPGQSWLEAAPAPLAAHIGQLVTDGILPPWPTWFGASTMARLVPDEAVREAFVADCPPVPISVLATPTPAVLFTGRHAYLRLSESYAEEEAEARNRGWIVRHEPLQHLAMLTHPDRLSDVIMEMAEELSAR